MVYDDKKQYKIDLKSIPKGKVNVGYEALTGNNAPSNLKNGSHPSETKRESES